jgi:hypothetical protein
MSTPPQLESGTRPYIWRGLIADFAFGNLQMLILLVIAHLTEIQWKRSASKYPTIVPQPSTWNDFAFRAVLGFVLHMAFFKRLRLRLGMSEGMVLIPLASWIFKLGNKSRF